MKRIPQQTTTGIMNKTSDKRNGRIIEEETRDYADRFSANPNGEVIGSCPGDKWATQSRAFQQVSIYTCLNATSGYLPSSRRSRGRRALRRRFRQSCQNARVALYNGPPIVGARGPTNAEKPDERRGQDSRQHTCEKRCTFNTPRHCPTRLATECTPVSNSQHLYLRICS